MGKPVTLRGVTGFVFGTDMNGVQVASLFGVLGLDDSDWNRKIIKADKKAQKFAGRIDGWAGKARALAGDLALVFGPVALGLGVAAKRAVDFDEAIANTAAVLGMTRAEQSLLAKDLLALGMTARAGPQRVAEAYYDIAGGVADTASHMDILNAAIAASEAGNADLGGVTKALIATMNGFGLKTKQAARASDVLTRTVGVGVGTMDELATALPDVAGLAHSLGIRLEDTGAILGFLSTKGNTFNQSATQMRQMMVALLNPNEKMKQVFDELGIASGKAAIEQFGLVGAFQHMQRESPTFVSNMAGVLGSVEALNGVTAVLGEDAAGFLANFSNGLEGATAAAQGIQNASPAAMWDLFISKVNGVVIVLGTALLPVLGQVIDKLAPVVTEVANWISANPELVGQIAMLAGGAMLMAPLLMGVSGALTAVKLAVWAVSAAFAVLTAPITAVVALVALMVKAYMDNFAGFRDFIDNKVRPFLLGLFNTIKDVVKNTFGWLDQYVLQPFITSINWIMDKLSFLQKSNNTSPAKQAFLDSLPNADNPASWGNNAPGGFNVPGMSNGGWTGGASPNDVTGVVHGQEWVIPTKGGPLLRERGGRSDRAEMVFGPGSVVIYANDVAGGRRAADGFETRLKERRRARGLT